MAIYPVEGNILNRTVDAIAFGANPDLLGGGPLYAQIVEGAGLRLEETLEAMLPCRVGEVCHTPGFDLRFAHIIHAVGPVWEGGLCDEAPLLANVYRNSLIMADGHGATSIAFANISTGANGFPQEQACSIAIEAVQKYLPQCNTLRDVAFACYDRKNYDLYHDALHAQDTVTLPKGQVMSRGLLREVARFISVVDAMGEDPVKRLDMSSMAPHVYKREVSQLTNLLYDAGIIGRGWQNRVTWANEVLSNPESIQTLDLTQISGMFTFLIRRERFIDGSIKAAFRERWIHALLKRLGELV